MKENKVIHGDCIEVMQSFEDNSIDAIVDDPPYALGFMGKEWDSFKPKQFQDFMFKVGKEKLRILKPGAYNLSFSGTRTYHRMVCGLEDAGFTIKDMIIWCYGSGFPKSLDISKSIDKYYGKKRKKVPVETSGLHKMPNLNDDNWKNISLVEPLMDSNIPITSEAQQWAGYGTALKPAFEPIVVAQKPIEGTYAENVLKYGIGGLNIKGCRIGYQSNKEVDSRIYNQDKNITRGKHGEASMVKYAPDGNEYPMYNSNQGRHPANLIFNHHPECKLIGTRKAGSGKPKHNQDINRKGPKWSGPVFSDSNSGFQSNAGQYLGNYGEQIIDAYNCHPDCPIRILDEQSGETISSKGGYTTKHQKDNRTHEWSKNGEWNTKEYINNAQWHTDKGGASRFFYCGKAYKSERNAGCKGLYWKKDKDDFIQITKEQYKLLPEDKRAKKNPVSTLKPINTIRYLIRLITPPNGVILDPFAGSGTMGIASIIEGFNYILIEKRNSFANIIIPKRLKYWKDPNHWEILKDKNALENVKVLKNKKQNMSIQDFIDMPESESKKLLKQNIIKLTKFMENNKKKENI